MTEIPSTGFQVIAVGEILIDFVSTTPGSLLKAAAFEKCFGGAPMNTIIGISKLGVRAGAITAVGDDEFGQFLINELKRNHVDVAHVKIKEDRRTTISFVANEPMSGERSFLFFRKPWITETADSALGPEDIDLSYISQANVLHVSGFALSQDPCRKAVFKAVKHAKRTGVRVSFDPTLRVDVWSSIGNLQRTYRQILGFSDIVTLSREEAEFIFGTLDPAKITKKALRHGVKVIGIKLGDEGCFIAEASGQRVRVPAFKVNAIDATGAGDGWNAGLLVGLCKGWGLKRCAIVANAIGAMVVMRRGAITALPDKNELADFLLQHNCSRYAF